MNTIFDAMFTGTDAYRACMTPDLYPNERLPVLQNWTRDDLEMYCGIYDKETRERIRTNG